jgi:ubiquinone/menaquinone biosynthesis C-methylase UbiE
MVNTKQHWEHVYRTKQPEEVSWTQAVPARSLSLIKGLHLPKSSRIIDIGGGDSKLVDYLLDQGQTKVTVIDISEHALERAKTRLGSRQESVQWIAGDITHVKLPGVYDLWHDRAAFHFLTAQSDIEKYLALLRASVSSGGHAIIATFSTSGPKKCSGLSITQYDEHSLSKLLLPDFMLIESLTEDHVTPFGTKQNFLFCLFEKAAGSPRV